ncbi:DUF2855 family protein [Myxococcota bacterium]|nr:DUF2855 family protein [Myxococcota bacterium]
MAADFEEMTYSVRRDDWSQGRLDCSTLPELGPSEVLFRVDRFALTSNNVTYAAAGDMLNYWGFFPADEGWGRVPVMGFGDVLASRHPEVAEGTRAFGFFPMSTHLVVEASGVTAHSFVDAAPHRSQHAPVYRQYQPVDADPHYDAGYESRILLLRGLFMTSFLVHGFLEDANGFGAERVLISSASSKTAIALAFLLSQRAGQHVVGFTSARHRAFVEGLGFYDEVLAYDEVEKLSADAPAVFVDHSGDGGFVNALHRHLGDQLRYSGIVGATHWSAGPRDTDLPGPEPAFFFAPGEITKRVEAWGPEGFQRRLGEGWRAFCQSSEGWLNVQFDGGPPAVERVFQNLLGGHASPQTGHILSLWEG